MRSLVSGSLIHPYLTGTFDKNKSYTDHNKVKAVNIYHLILFRPVHKAVLKIALKFKIMKINQTILGSSYL